VVFPRFHNSKIFRCIFLSYKHKHPPCTSELILYCSSEQFGFLSIPPLPWLKTSGRGVFVSQKRILAPTYMPFIGENAPNIRQMWGCIRFSFVPRNETCPRRGHPPSSMVRRPSSSSPDQLILGSQSLFPVLCSLISFLFSLPSGVQSTCCPTTSSRSFHDCHPRRFFPHH
jgi:hypothetical protein